MKAITNNFTGKEKLAIVFWVHNFAIGTVLSLIIVPAVLLLLIYGNLASIIITVSILPVWFLWVIAGMWTCAYNVQKAVWGHFSRGYVLLVCLSILFGMVNQYLSDNPLLSP